jgi:hypothetical protein
VKAVPGIGAEIVLTVNGEMRRTRLFRSHEQAELVGAIADNFDPPSAWRAARPARDRGPRFQVVWG